MQTLKLDDLLKISLTETRSKCEDILLGEMMNCDTVGNTIFSADDKKNVVHYGVFPSNHTTINKLSCAAVCEHIKNYTQGGFNKTINSVEITLIKAFFAMEKSVHNEIFNFSFNLACKNKFGSNLEEIPVLKEWDQELNRILKLDQFLITEKFKTQDNTMLLKENLLFYLYKFNRIRELLQSPAESDLNEILDFWKAYFSLDFTDSDSKTIENKFIPLDLFGNNLFDKAKFDFRDVVDKLITETETHKEEYTQYIPTGYPYLAPSNSVRERIITGPKIASFLKQENVKETGLLSGTAPDNETLKYPSSCFTEETLILLNSKELIPISKVEEGDFVLSKDGKISIRSKTYVKNPVKKRTRIFGFNDEKPFFTAGHPFWTKDNIWKALNPEIALDENPDLKISKLDIGDYVCRIKSEFVNGDYEKPEYDWIEIKEITHKIMETGFVYGLHLIEGPSAYHANGYLVKMNYPMITEQTLKDGIKSLSKSEQKRLKEALFPVMDLLKKFVGNYVEDALIRSFDSE